jgi:hypothetical protein
LNSPDNHRIAFFNLAGLPALLCLSALITGCMTTRVEETKDSATGLKADESVVIIASSYHTTDPAEDAFMECVIKRVQSGRGKLKVHPAAELRDAVFPWLEPRTAPQKVADLPKLLERPGINERISARSIRYLIWIKGDTERTNSGGSLSCAAGPTGGACFGLAWWENLSAYEATVWDLDDGVKSGMVSTSVNGTSVIPALIVPLPFIARTRSAACKGMSNQLKNFVSGGS